MNEKIISLNKCYHYKILFINLLIVILSFSTVSSTTNCKLNITCVNNTICLDSGICSCPQYYFGSDCDKLLSDSKELNIHSSGITSSGFTGLIVGMTISFPVVLILGLLIIFYSLKDRDY